jgi:PAS domain S-box-containing protein
VFKKINKKKKSNQRKKIGKPIPEKTSDNQIIKPQSDQQEIINKLETATNSLRTIKDNLNQIIENTSEGILVVDQIGGLKYVNSYALKILGKTVEELREEKFEAGHLIGKQTEFKFHIDDEFVGTGEMLVTQIKWENDQVYLILIRDITERKEIEQSYAQLYENAPVGYHEIDKSGTIIQVNATELKMLGFESHEMIGKKLWDFMASASPSIEAMKGKMKGVNIPSKDLERSYIKKNGDEIIVLAEDQILYDQKGKITGMLSTMQNITDRKKASEEVRRLSNFPLRYPTPIVEMDFKGNNTYINPAGLDLLNHMDLNPEDVHLILPPNYRQLIATNLEGSPQPQEVNVEDKVLLWSFNALEDLELVHLYATDITDLKNTELALIAAKERAEASDKLKNIFLSTMSHEVRTPLNVILGYTDLLAMELQDKVPEEMETFFSDIQKNGERLKQLIDDIMDISLIEADKTILAYELIPPNDLVEEAVLEIESWATEKGLTVKREYNAGDIFVKIDRVRSLQALGNLLNNAVKFTEKGDIIIRTYEKDGNLKIQIEDTGIGIGADFLPTLFTVFRQAEEGFERSYEGAGIGLAISNRLFNAMNGEIDVSSTQGKGSIFTVTLPIAKPEEIIELTPKPDEEELQKTEQVISEKKAITKPYDSTILVIEDNPANLDYIIYLLQKLSLPYTTAANAVDGFKILQKIPVNCMLVDISLGDGISGIEFLRKVRSEPKFKDIFAIAVTAHALKGDKRRFLEHGFDDYLSKPFVLNELKDILERNTEQ